jgi:hypothetical protein
MEAAWPRAALGGIFQQAAKVWGANRRWRLPFRYRGSGRESAVVQLFTLCRMSTTPQSTQPSEAHEELRKSKEFQDELKYLQRTTDGFITAFTAITFYSSAAGSLRGTPRLGGQDAQPGYARRALSQMRSGFNCH